MLPKVKMIWKAEYKAWVNVKWEKLNLTFLKTLIYSVN
ncbi:hypothetical protein ACIN5065_A0037 [Acinetobacter baumannii OIFC065]|nr:hypothetical protein ACIN5065_A0037 [Acinetobacter baumannii OIFC065]